MEICKTYFRFNNDIINGYKVIDNNGKYDIFVYTSCQQLGNWQLFLTLDKEKLLKYFKNQVNNFIEQSLKNDWCETELKWYKNTYNILKEKLE
ncbi:hypothetical protein DVV91_16970 [Clostridium botulinum]|uniref:hypothetical protein n=1 Tax=Clostridium botulinum TaxID=1491 RepID=UPI001967A269|nr:hypothetical protein [Clostridium botulinum]MBN1076015.1 hypothetical protein [Clostridium botulinum]